MDVVKLVKADAERRLAGALKTRRGERIASALQEIVEASLPDPGMPKSRIRRAHPAAAGNPHRVWRWVTRDGLAHLVAQTLPDWKTIVVSAHVTFPGISGRSELLYRDTTDLPEQVGLLVRAAVRQLSYRSLG